jgi:spore coat polysaccharide biosynthesis protein SpsF
VIVSTFVQARMGSRRLPGKSMLPVWHQMPLIELVLRRVLAAQSPARVVLVTGRAERDRVLVDVASRLGVAAVRGSENDVLERYTEALERNPSDAVVRVCADNPFVEPGAIDELTAFFEQQQPCDYASNLTIRSGLPDGIGAEVIAATALRRAAAESKSAYEREHVPGFILNRPSRFTIAHSPAPIPPWPRAKLDIDTAKDWVAIRRLTERLPDARAPLWDRGAIVSAWLRAQREPHEVQDVPDRASPDPCPVPLRPA